MRNPYLGLVIVVVLIILGDGLPAGPDQEGPEHEVGEGKRVHRVLPDEDEEESEESEEPSEEEPSEEEPAVETYSVEEMMTEGYGKVKEAAVAYEKDEYQDHTVEMYMKENAALVATLATKAMEEAIMELEEGEMTVEMYEAHCNEMKEAYAKKIEELKEVYGAGKE